MGTQYDMSLRHGVDFDFRLDGKVAVVTGGLGGIAMATNAALIAKGARVAILYPSFEEPRVQAAIDELGADNAKAFCLRCRERRRCRARNQSRAHLFRRPEFIGECRGLHHAHARRKHRL